MKQDQYFSARYIRPDSICVEIGTWEGDFSYDILLHTTLKKLYCIDPYKHFNDGEYPDNMNDRSQQEWDEKFAKVQKRFEPFGDRVELMRMSSLEASSQFQDESIDYIYIDGNHEYKAVLTDILAWFPKVKKGGILCGDDIVSTDISEHDADGNVTRIWKPGCGGKYGTYKALLDAQELLGFGYTIYGTQFAFDNLSWIDASNFASLL
jgi:hypothetical protein